MADRIEDLRRRRRDASVSGLFSAGSGGAGGGGAYVPLPPPPPPPQELEVQHAWKSNGPFPPVPKTNVDGDMVFGFSGTINFAVFKRRQEGSGGSSTFDIKKNGVTIFTVVPTINAIDGADKAIQVTALALPVTFTTFDNFRFDILTKETGNPRDVVAILDVTRTGA